MSQGSVEAVSHVDHAIARGELPAARTLRNPAAMDDVSLRVIGGTERANVADAVRRYVAARESLENQLGAERAFCDTVALHFVSDLVRPVVAARIARAAGLAVHFSDRLAAEAPVPRALRRVASEYLDAAVHLGLAAACFGGPGSSKLVRRAVAEFSMRAQRYVSARAEQLSARHRGVTRKYADAELRDALRCVTSAAAVVSEVISLETDVVAFA